MAGDSAATAATRSPTWRTLSSKLTWSQGLGLGQLWPPEAYFTRVVLKVCSTAWTPGSARASESSMATMRAWACGLRSTLAWSIPRSSTSSTNAGWPLTSLTASTLAAPVPTTVVGGTSGGGHEAWPGRRGVRDRPVPAVRRGRSTMTGAIGSGFSPRSSAAARCTASTTFT